MATTGNEQNRPISSCLPRWEQKLYSCVWVVLVARAVYAVYKDSYGEFVLNSQNFRCCRNLEKELIRPRAKTFMKTIGRVLNS